MGGCSPDSKVDEDFVLAQPVSFRVPDGHSH